MTTPSPPYQAPPLVRIADLIWVSLPLRLRRFSGGLAVAGVDGLYIAARPALGAFAPIAAAGGGFLVGALHPGFEVVPTEALWLIVLIAVVGTLSGALGLYLTVGYAAGDLMLGEHPAWRFADDDVMGLLARYGSVAVLYLLVAMLAVGVPVAAKSLAAEFMLPPTMPRPLRGAVGLAAMVAITGLLVFVWTQSAPLLVRPVFVWLDLIPTVAAIEPVQEDGAIIVVFAVLAAVARAAIQAFMAGTVGRRNRMAELEERFRAAGPIEPLLSRSPLVLRLVLRAGLLTLVLSGLFAAYWQAGLTFLVLLGAQALGTTLSVRALAGYARAMNRVPRLIRLLIVVVPVYLLGSVVLGYFLRRGAESFLPFLTLTVVSAVLMSLLSPPRPEERPAAPAKEVLG